MATPEQDKFMQVVLSIPPQHFSNPGGTSGSSGSGQSAGKSDAKGEGSSGTGAGTGSGQAPANAANGGGDYAQGVAKHLADKIKGGGDLRFDLAMLSHMEMATLLDVMANLKKAGQLDDFAVPSEQKRIGVAILTVQGDCDAQWQELVAKLNAEDRQAVLARVPANVKAKLGTGPAPRSGSAKPGDDDSDPGGTVEVGSDGAGVSAKFSVKSDLFGSLQLPDVIVHLGPKGELKQLEMDLTLLKQKIQNLGALSNMLELEATLSLNATAGLDQKQTRVIFTGVQGQVKGELEAHFKTEKIPLLKKIAFKLTATAGSTGINVGGSIEIPIPGT